MTAPPPVIARRPQADGAIQQRRIDRKRRCLIQPPPLDRRASLAMTAPPPVIARRPQADGAIQQRRIDRKRRCLIQPPPHGSPRFARDDGSTPRHCEEAAGRRGNPDGASQSTAHGSPRPAALAMAVHGPGAGARRLLRHLLDLAAGAHIDAHGPDRGGTGHVGRAPGRPSGLPRSGRDPVNRQGDRRGLRARRGGAATGSRLVRRW